MNNRNWWLLRYSKDDTVLTEVTRIMKTVVVSEEIHSDGIDLLNSRPDVKVLDARGDAARLRELMPQAHGVLIRTLYLDADMMASAKQLEVVSRHGVGCDNIDVSHLSERKIPIAIATDSNTTSVVEQVLMMMLALNKRAFQYDALTRDNQFHQRCQHATSELLDKKILIVGFGRIGKRLAPVCKAFGMNVTVADIALDVNLATDLGCQGVTDFRAHLADTDYLSVHVPLHNGISIGLEANTSTFNLIGEKELASLPAHAFVINCARGGIVDEAAMATAINKGVIAGFGCDVFVNEPPAPDNPLLRLPNTIYSPHNAASTNEGLSRMASYAAQNTLDAFDGKLRPEMIFNAAALSS